MLDVGLGTYFSHTRLNVKNQNEFPCAISAWELVQFSGWLVEENSEMKLPIVFASGSTMFLLGIPLSLVAGFLGSGLMIGGSIIIGAWVIAKSLRPNLD